MIITRPKLIPAPVPWSIATSDEELFIVEESATDELILEFTGYFRLYDYEGSTTSVISSLEETDYVSDHYSSPYKRVRLTFHQASGYRFRERFNDAMCIDESAYDLTDVVGMIHSNETLDSFFRRVDRFQLDTGLSPNPGMFHIDQRETSSHTPGAIIYIVIGSSGSYEIHARAFDWQIFEVPTDQSQLSFHR